MYAVAACFTDELQPRDVVAAAIFNEMEKENSNHVWLSLAPIDEAVIQNHFPNIYEHCLEEGYDVTKEPIPVVPAQHYFMGGVKVNMKSKTTSLGCNSSVKRSPFPLRRTAPSPRTDSEIKKRLPGFEE